jgi:hypothetical protein
MTSLQQHAIDPARNLRSGLRREEATASFGAVRRGCKGGTRGGLDVMRHFPCSLTTIGSFIVD